MSLDPEASAGKSRVTNESEIQLCTFMLSGRRYGVDVLDVREINSEFHLTPVAHAPEGVLGLVNVRGQVFVVLDLSLTLGLEPTKPTDSSRLVLFKERVGPSFGVLVDDVGDILVAHNKHLVAIEEGSGADAATDGIRHDLVREVCKVDGSLVVVVHASALMDAVRRDADNEAQTSNRYALPH